MLPSKLSIMNTARALVGAKRMATATATDSSAKTTIALYGVAQMEVFDLPYDWQFCSARAQLAAMDDDPPFGYDYQYPLPANCRRIRAQVDKTGDKVEYEWRREVYIIGAAETDVMLTDQTSPTYIKYTVFRAAEASYPAWFAKLIYLNLALMLAEPLKKDKAKAADLFKTYELSQRDAEAANAIEMGMVSDKYVALSKGNTDVVDSAYGDEVTTGQTVIRVIEP